MKWRIPVSILIICLLYAIVPLADDSQTKIVGKWKTDVILSQLGRIVDWREFKEDGTFNQKLDFIDGAIPAFVTNGTYRLDANKLTTFTQIKTHASTFRFEGEEMVIDDGGKEVYRYKRVQ